VTIVTPDGWRLGADLFLPASDEPAPAVVLMHTGRSDREVFDRLAPLLAVRGVAALALDWRGRGASTNLGRFVDFTSEQQAGVPGDVTASYDSLCARPEIDGTRLATLGIAHGAGYGVTGALTDTRTKAVAMMTAYHLLEPEQAGVLQSGAVAVLCVACTPNKLSTGALREIYRCSANRNSRLMEFPEGVLGYQLFELHPDLEPSIADWFAEVLLR
jgi:dienelactone hydrolase